MRALKALPFLLLAFGCSSGSKEPAAEPDYKAAIERVARDNLKAPGQANVDSCPTEFQNAYRSFALAYKYAKEAQEVSEFDRRKSPYADADERLAKARTKLLAIAKEFGAEVSAINFPAPPLAPLP